MKIAVKQSRPGTLSDQYEDSVLLRVSGVVHRLQPGHLLDLAVQGEEGLCVDRRELRRAARLPGSRSYTVDTLRELRMELGDEAPWPC